MVFYVSRGTQCVRSHVIPGNPRTAAQQSHRHLFAHAVNTWQKLDLHEKQRWNRVGLLAHTSGYSLFISSKMKGIRLSDIVYASAHHHSHYSDMAKAVQIHSPSVCEFACNNQKNTVNSG
jgi:hypothetical protein